VKGLITIDGDLGDAGWKKAAVIGAFWETSPGNNVPSKVKTTAWVTYDDRYVFIAVKCDDPDASRSWPSPSGARRSGRPGRAPRMQPARCSPRSGRARLT